MRILTVILLFLSLSVEAQDTLTYSQFKTAMINMETIRPVKFTESPVFKPMVILGSTFVVNTIVGNAMYKNKPTNPMMSDIQNEKIMKITFTIYISGATLALIFFLYDTINLQ